MSVMPGAVLKKLYVKGSLRLRESGFAFDLKNVIAPATITLIDGLELDGERLDAARAAIVLPRGASRPLSQVSPGRPVEFPVGTVVTVHVSHKALEPGEHSVAIRVQVKEIGSLEIPFTDTIS
jgi:hypothetical protein